jgi:dienelactone hydrolase
MQPPGTAPKLIRIAEHAAAYGTYFSPPPPDVPARLPFIVFSHGLGGSPISPGYIEAMTELASQGYMVGAVFHGDARFSRIRLDDLGDLVFLLTEFGKFAEMQLMRPLSLKALTDHILARPEYAAGIDPDRIGAFGTSMGGQAVANLVGARLTTSIDRNCSATVRDLRIKAAVGYVPYAGQSFLPSFCDGQSGAADVARPYLAIAGTADTTAPIGQIRQAVNRMGDSRYLVELAGVAHEYLDAHRGDVFTWTVNFLNAYLVPAFDPQAVNRLIVQGDVAGGPFDQLTIDRHVPFRVLPGEAVAFEFHEPGTDRYRYGPSPDPLDAVDSRIGPGWEPTDFSFKAYAGLPGEIDSMPMRRERAGRAGSEPSGFFLEMLPEREGETEQVPMQRAKRAGGWFDQALGFHARPPLPGGTCPPGHLQLLRATKPGVPALDANRRFTTSDSEATDMARRGWRLDGVEFCVLP